MRTELKLNYEQLDQIEGRLGSYKEAMESLRDNEEALKNLLEV